MKKAPTLEDFESFPAISAAELAALLRVPQTTIRRLRLSGELPPSIKVGRSIRFPLPEVRAWIEAEKAKSGRPQPADRGAA